MEKSKFDRYPRLTITGLILIGLVLVLFILELSLRFISPIAVSNVGFVDTINGKISINDIFFNLILYSAHNNGTSKVGVTKDPTKYQISTAYSK